MCGIIGIIGKDAVAAKLLAALRRLEYRGYDSAGVATLVEGGIERRRAEGKLDNLERRLQMEPIAGRTGIGHTRWATHGVPNEKNAHPHATDRVAVVHNGIIENYQALRDELTAAGRELASDTDTEVVAHLITRRLEAGDRPEEATRATLARLEGAFALGIVFAGEEDLMIAARRGSPLAIGIGEGETYLGSDALALAPLTDSILYLEDGDWAVMAPTGVTVYGADGKVTTRKVRKTTLRGGAVGKGGYPHFML
ncbi:MAG TPA: glutamine--fructose-6-phosphate aminotransferase, partial [Rhodospirillales bacterium]